MSTIGMLFVVLGYNRNGGRSYRGCPSPTTSNHPSAFDATSAPYHKGRLEEIRVTIGCSACSEKVVHGKTSQPHTEECRSRIGEQMEHDPEGHERLQGHKRRRDVEPEIGANRAPVARENEGDPAPQEQQDVEILGEALVESASVKRGSDAVADNEERARLRLRAEGKRGQKTRYARRTGTPGQDEGEARAEEGSEA